MLTVIIDPEGRSPDAEHKSPLGGIYINGGKLQNMLIFWRPFPRTRLSPAFYSIIWTDLQPANKKVITSQLTLPLPMTVAHEHLFEFEMIEDTIT